MTDIVEQTGLRVTGCENVIWTEPIENHINWRSLVNREVEILSFEKPMLDLCVYIEYR